jgi:G:T/U-mismatch repair DNA glycosylase
LCAELSVFPQSAEALFRRYGLDTAERRSAVDAAWKERLRRDPAEHRAWYERCACYRAYWAKRSALLG